MSVLFLQKYEKNLFLLKIVVPLRCLSEITLVRIGGIWRDSSVGRATD